MFVKYSVFITCMYLLRDMPIVMGIYLIQIYTFLLFNVLKRGFQCISIYLDNKLFLFLFLKLMVNGVHVATTGD